jgi:glycine/D-amino acid oxidase-like deaminating enzyme
MRYVADVAIVGAGIAGASVAYYASKAGLRVVVIDRGPPAGGATGMAAANIRCHHTLPFEAQMAIEARELFANWDDEVGGDCGFRPIGGLFIVGPADAERLRRNVDMLRGLGLDTTAVDAPGLRELQPFMATDDVGAAAYEPGSGYADPSLAVAGLLARARERGATMLFDRGPARLRAESVGVAGVDAGDDAVIAPSVVLACGVAARDLARAVGVDVPVYPFPLGAGVMRRPESVGPPMATIDLSLGLWYRADVGDRVFVEAGYRDLDLADPPSLDHFTAALPPTPDELVEAAETLTRRIPGLADGVPGRTWAGLDSCTPDGHAIAGAVPGAPGLFLLTGANGLFVRMAPRFARRLVGAMTGDAAAAAELAPYSFARFGEGKAIHAENEYGLGSFS